MLHRKLEHLDPSSDPLHDFRNFMYVCFTEVFKLGPPDPIQYALAYRMAEGVGEGGPRVTRKQIQALRGCGKSVIVCCFIAWLWYCNPTIRVVVLSSVAKKANELASLVKQILDGMEVLQHLRPDPDADITYRRGKKIKRLKSDKNTEDTFDVRGAGPGKDPSFAAYPVFGGWTGSHPDVIIPDDTEIPENSLTALKRSRLFEKLRECESLIMEGGLILYMGTPQTEESIYIKLKDQGYPIFRFPAQYPDPDSITACENVDSYLLDRLRSGEASAGDPTYPERFPKERLLEKRAMGLAYYNLQYLLDTTLSDIERYPLKLRDLIVFDTPADMAPSNIVWGTANPLNHIDAPGFSGDLLHGPGYVEDRWLPFTNVIMYIDPKGGGADSVGWAVGGFLNGIIYCLDAGGLAPREDGTAEGVLVALAKIADTYGVKQILVESNWGGSTGVSAYAKLLAPHVAKWCGPVEIDTRQVKGQKERRILDTMEPIVHSHRLVLSEKAARCSDLMYQFTHITRDSGSLSHDDELDALHGMINEFVHLINLDPEVREQQRRESDARALAEEWDRETSRHGIPMDVVSAPRQPKTRLTRGRWSRL